MMSALARRLSYEDRLTELLASVLKGDAELRAELLHRRGLGGFDAGLPEVQVRTGEGLRTMDMHIPLSATKGAVAEAWWEHKLGVGFGDGQLEAYERALGRRRAEGAEIHFTVVADQRRWWPSAEEQGRLQAVGAKLWSWHRVAEAVEAVLVKFHPDWYRVALAPDASARIRVLAELAAYLEDYEEVAVTGPFDGPKLSALQNIDAAHRTAEGLLERVAQELQPGVETDVDGRHAPHEAWVSVASVGWWNELHEGWLWLYIAPYAWFDDEAEQVPSFGVSVHLDSDERPRLNADRRFARAVDTENLRLGSHWESDVALGDSMPLEGIAGIPSLTDQARELAKFARDAILRLVRCPPQGTHRRARPNQPDVLIAPVVLDPRKFCQP